MPKSRLLVALTSFFEPTAPATGLVNIGGEFAIDLPEREGSENLAGCAILAATGNVELGSMTDSLGRSLAFGSVNSVVVVARKTGPVVTGTLAFTVPVHAGGSISQVFANDEEGIAQVPVGGILSVWSFASIMQKAPVSGADIAVTMTLPVGFRTEVYVNGLLSD